jgi:uncharacterized membrane protein
MNRYLRGGLVGFIGYLLSPLSWWNDLFINIPLAYVFGCLLGLISRTLFLPSMIAGYWITNIAGFILMHYGAKDLISKGERSYTKREILHDVLFSLVYSAIVIIMVKKGWLQFPADYFK